MHAILRGQTLIVQQLLAAGVDANIRNNKEDRPQVVAVLLEMGTGATAQDSNGLTPPQLVHYYQRDRIRKIFLEHIQLSKEHESWKGF
jgi:ankyrin repeat protein